MAPSLVRNLKKPQYIGLIAVAGGLALWRTGAWKYVAYVLGFVPDEQQPYRVIGSDGDFELRSYPAALFAEVGVSGGYHEASRAAFLILADYIFGNNRSKRIISMTAPVVEQPVAEKISMTAPVLQRREAEGWRMSFFMPGEYDRKTLPEPRDPRIRIREVGPRTLVALRFSGKPEIVEIERRKERLLKWVEAKGLQLKGEPALASFNPPFALPFLRRNEIQAEIL